MGKLRIPAAGLCYRGNTGERRRGLWKTTLLQNQIRLIVKESSSCRSILTERAGEVQGSAHVPNCIFSSLFVSEQIGNGSINHSESLTECPEGQRGFRELPSHLF